MGKFSIHGYSRHNYALTVGISTLIAGFFTFRSYSKQKDVKTATTAEKYKKETQWTMNEDNLVRTYTTSHFHPSASSGGGSSRGHSSGGSSTHRSSSGSTHGGGRKTFLA